MEDFKSNSSNEWSRTQLENFAYVASGAHVNPTSNPSKNHDLRCYSSKNLSVPSVNTKPTSNPSGIHDLRYYSSKNLSVPSVNTKPTLNPSGIHDLRCYSTSYVSSSSWNNNTQMEMVKEVKFKKAKSTNGSTSKNRNFVDPELQRKKRVASYKVYTVEGNVKGSIKKSFLWIKEKCSKVIYRWR